jgi:endothelin-converting enzyme/putative endopeptidase
MYLRAWLVLFGLMSGFGAAHAAQTSLVFFGATNEPLSQGQQYRLTPADGRFSISFPDAVTLTLTVENLPAVLWQLKLAAADGAPLTIGSYESAQGVPVQESGHPRLDFSGNGTGCYAPSGRFDILELDRDAQGNVVHLAVHFEQHCDGQPPALIGEVRYDSDVPITPFIGVQNALNNQGCIMAAGPHPALVRLQLANAVDSAGGSLLNYAWSSSTGAAGTAAEFQAPTPLGATATVDLTLTDPASARVVQLSREVCVSKPTSLFYYRPGGGPDSSPDLYERIEANDRPFKIRTDNEGQFLQLSIPWSPEYPEEVTAIFTAPGTAALATGIYDRATRFPAPPGNNQAALTFSPANADESGRFQILELVRNLDGKVIGLAVDFEVHSMFSSEIYYGQIRYNSEVPMTPVIAVESPQAPDDCIDVSTPPGPTVKLRAHGGEQVSYRWTSSTGATATGTAFQFLGAFEAQPQITLTVTDLVTGSDTVVTKNLCVDPPSMLHLESQTGDPVGAGQNTTLWPPLPAFGYHPPFVETTVTGAENDAILTIGGQWNLQLGSGSTDPLTVGVYDNARGGNLNDGTAPLLAFQSSTQLVCRGYTGRFEILDIQHDAQHRLTRLAVDFEQTCNGASGKLTGQLRYKSSLSVDPNQIDLVVTLTTPAQPPQVGRQGNYQLAVTNQGALPATQPVVTVTLPSIVATAALPPNCRPTGPGLSCSLDTLAPNAAANLELTLGYQAPGHGTIAAAVAADTADFDLSNNHASQLTTIPIDPAAVESQVADAMDPSVDPCQDFYTYACGGWLSNNQTLPDDRSHLVRGPDTASDEVRGKLYILMQAAAEAPGLDADQQRVGSLFSACMNEVGIEQDGLAALNPILTKIDQIANHGDFLRMAGELTRLGAPTLISPLIGPDIRSYPNQYIVFAYAGQPGYPDGDVYRRHDRDNTFRRRALNDYVVKALGLLGDGKPAQHARDILRIEKTVARFDPGYGHTGRMILIPAGFVPRLPLSLQWQQYLQGVGLGNDGLIVVDKTYLQSVTALLAKLPIESLKAYLRWQLVASFHDLLPKAFQPDGSISGVVVAEPERWKTCVDATSELLGDVVGKMLVESEGAGEQVPLAEDLLEGVRQAFAAQEASLPFLATTSSRTAVQRKLDALVAHVGFPETWTIFAGSDTAETTFLGKAMALAKDVSDRNTARVGRNVERSPWDSPMGVQTVNAYNNIWTNEMYMFAGMLRRPFMDNGYPLAMTYGGLGVILAHELVHGFDANGRYFGPNGSFELLLTPGDNRRYNARAQCFVKQYSQYSGAEGTRVNGKKTLSENLSDNGGVHLAYQAFKNALITAPTQPQIANLTPEQLFFTAYAQMYCEASTPESARYRYSRTWNRYAPWRYRAIAPLVNSPDFAEAFQCPADSPMNPEKKCALW